ncbi:MAG TPA: hypothetical protein VFD33_06305 [Bacillota bacterium]|nr:hypothetical protein [Bacillota bacterium]
MAKKESKPVGLGKDKGFVALPDQYRNEKDYYLLCASGTQDIAYPNMKPQIDAMKKFKDSFVYSADIIEGNFYFIECDGGIHNWHWANQFIYNILADFFQK